MDMVSWIRAMLARRARCKPSPASRRHLGIEWLESRVVPAAPILVTTLDDAAVAPMGSLRWAIDKANMDVGQDTIQFKLGVGAKTVTVKNSSLPLITDEVIFDGTVTNGNAGQKITIQASTAALDFVGASGVGLNFGAGSGNSRVYGLTLIGFRQDGILITGVSNIQIGGVGANQGNTIGSNGFGIRITGTDAKSNRILGNFIGTDAASSATLGNTQSGVKIEQGASLNEVGGNMTAHRNIISNNTGTGVYIQNAPSNFVLGNFIGTNVAGTADLGNAGWGVLVKADVGYTATNNQIGSNVISSNKTEGIRIASTNTTDPNLVNGDASGTTIVSNLIGTDVTGLIDLGNAGYGIDIARAGGFKIGGAMGQAALANVISANKSNGISVLDASNGYIRGNIIGVGKDKTTVLPNVGDGVVFSGTAAGTTVEGNTIKKNTGKGINDQPAANKIKKNVLSLNDGLGIDIGQAGVTLAGLPVITAAAIVGQQTSVQGTLSSTPNATFDVEFFGNIQADPSGYGEGEVYLGTVTMTTDSSGNASYSALLNAAYGAYLTATATNTSPSGNTSEFSAAFLVSNPNSGGGVSGRAWQDNGNGIRETTEAALTGVGISLTDAASVVHTTQTDASGNYTFTGVPLGAYSISVSVPSGQYLTGYHQGTDPTLDSDFAPTTGLASGTLTSSNPFAILDAGFVAMAATSTTLTASTSNSFAGQAITLTATVSPSSFGGTPTGTVTFMDGNVSLGSVALSTGTNGMQAVFSIATLSVGSHSLTAVYNGSATYTGSTSTPLTVTVQIGTVMEMLSSSNSSVLFGTAVTFTATIYPSSQGVAPTGTIAFYDGNTLLATISLSHVGNSYQATFTISTLARGSHSISAVYSGDQDFLGASSSLTEFVY